MIVPVILLFFILFDLKLPSRVTLLKSENIIPEYWILKVINKPTMSKCEVCKKSSGDLFRPPCGHFFFHKDCIQELVEMGEKKCSFCEMVFANCSECGDELGGVICKTCNYIKKNRCNFDDKMVGPLLKAQEWRKEENGKKAEARRVRKEQAKAEKEQADAEKEAWGKFEDWESRRTVPKDKKD